METRPQPGVSQEVSMNGLGAVVSPTMSWDLSAAALLVARRDDLNAQAARRTPSRCSLALATSMIAEVHGLDLGQRLVHGGDHRAADNARADQYTRSSAFGGGGILGHQAADGGGAHRGDERAVQNAERQHRLGVTQDGNVDAVGDARDRGVLLGLRRPLDAADVACRRRCSKAWR